MSRETVESQGPANYGSNRWIYWTVGAVVVILLVVGLITWSGGKNNREAQQKAEQLTQKFEQAGLRVPVDQETITRSLGTDGGPVCDNPGKALGKSILFDQFTNGADFVGRRPVIVPRSLIQGQALILQTYCPDKLQQFKDKFDDLKFDDTIKP